MKYAWIEETEVVNGEEILDVGDVPFDPPQYEQITQGTGSGPVVGLNRGAIEGERQGNITPQHLVWGMDTEAYRVVANEFQPLDNGEYQALLAQRQAEKDAQEQALADLEVRVAELEAEQEASGMINVTAQQAKNYIDSEFANATNNAEIVDAIKRILKKIVVFIIKVR